MHNGDLLAYGGDGAMRSYAYAYANWTSRGLLDLTQGWHSEAHRPRALCCSPVETLNSARSSTFSIRGWKAHKHGALRNRPVGTARWATATVRFGNPKYRRCASALRSHDKS
jgi:hypothetical protein